MYVHVHKMFFETHAAYRFSQSQPRTSAQSGEKVPQVFHQTTFIVSPPCWPLLVHASASTVIQARHSRPQSPSGPPPTLLSLKA